MSAIFGPTLARGGCGQSPVKEQNDPLRSSRHRPLAATQTAPMQTPRHRLALSPSPFLALIAACPCGRSAISDGALCCGFSFCSVSAALLPLLCVTLALRPCVPALAHAAAASRPLPTQQRLAGVKRQKSPTSAESGPKPAQIGQTHGSIGHISTKCGRTQTNLANWAILPRARERARERHMVGTSS